ncbi:MAG TPA: aminotransferase class I/II-fold pyridoxal phosphate-dependent enzyme [bacterium]|nr:aminotransferase class I/II-fold pyridoxal phosphate-dependent enzyme [bacterium]HPO81655.1 aminotransferase class I/II-fold pyridoxal phosphate-dependent enzyme [bacterium]
MDKGTRTKIQHYGEDYSKFLGAISPPIFEASNFAFSSYEEVEEHQEGKLKDKFTYTRGGNPTVRILENKIAMLEKGDACRAFSSGMGAITASILSLIKGGDHIVCLRGVYNPAYEFIDSYLSRFNVSSSFVEGKDLSDIESAIRPNTRVIYLESPNSLIFEVFDLREIARMARERGIYTIIDNTWATPYFQNPIEYGIDVVVHSASKYLGGHSDVVAGLVITNKELIKGVSRELNLIGSIIGPFEAWLILRGLRSLPSRMELHQNNAMKVAQYLENHPRVIKVNYPGLPSNPQHQLAISQLRGFSGLMSFELDGGEKELRKFVNNLKLFAIAVSWGGYESLIFPTGRGFPKDRKDKVKISPQLLRISVGLEDAEDLIEDLENAFKKAFN